MKVLIAEDNEDSRNLLAETVRAYGHEVMAAANGAEALEQALAQPPDIIVSDILMPKMDDYQLCQKWKQNDKLKDIPFVFYTATYTSEEDEGFAVTLGASTFIRKPTDPDIFIQALSEVFEKAKSGALAPTRVAPLEPSIFLTEYTKRVVAKLEDKVAQLQESEKKIKYIDSVLRAIRSINQLAVREKDKAKLLQGACEILIKVREYRFAWIGLVAEGHKRVLPVAQAGFEEGYLDSVKVTWDDAETGKGPTGTAIKTKQPSFMRNIAKDPKFEPWREEALKRGYLSSAAIPLVHDEKVYGVLNVYSSQRDGFDDEETGLLVEVSGDLAFALKAIDDEEQRKQAEKELRIKDSAIASSINAIAITDLEGNQTYVNPSFLKLWGYDDEDEVLGRHASEFSQITEDVTTSMEALFKEGGWRGESVARRKDGSMFDVQLSTTLVTDEDGKPICIMASFIDITERKQAEEEKGELERKAQLSSRLASIGQMASGIAHEINNPLTSVIGFADLLMARKDLPDDIREDLEVIHSGSVRVADIVKGLLTFARQDKAGKEYANINKIIESTLTLRAYEIKTGSIELKTYLDPDLPNTMAVGGQLQQVFLNLMINAEGEMRRAHDKGNLLVKTEVVGDVIRISFKDDGPGIARENLDRIFEPFFTTKKPGEGTGLGLSVCYGIIADHNGQIYAESKRGKGATFIVELPIVTKESQLELAEPEAEELKGTAGARILVVDDEPGVRQFLSRLLTDEGHEVETVDNARDALERLKKDRYNLILLDIKMPEMSGIELYKRIRKIAESLAKRVVFITGDVIGADTRSFLSRSKALYISKPFDTEQLKREINRILTTPAA